MREVDALPSTDSPSRGHTQAESELVPVIDILGIDLPPTEVVNSLLDSYNDSVYWYIRIIHEPSLRTRLLPIAESGLASRKQRPLLLLALVVLVIGAKFKPDGARAGSREEAASAELVSGMILAAERWYLPSMDLIIVDTVS